MRRLAAAGFVVAAITVFAGCAGDDAKVAPAKPEKPGTPSAAAKSALADPGSAASAVRTFWRFLGTGALPGAVDIYDDNVVQAVGLATFGGTMAAQQGSVSVTKLNVLDVARAAGGTLVFAEIIPEAGAKTSTTFFLERQNRRWQIVYDTFSANALAAYVQQQEQRRIDPTATAQPSPKSFQAADKAVASFRQVALSPRPQTEGTGKGRTAAPNESRTNTTDTVP